MAKKGPSMVKNQNVNVPRDTCRGENAMENRVILYKLNSTQRRAQEEPIKFVN